MIAGSFPNAVIPDLGCADYVISSLYRFQPPRQFNDAILRDVCDRIQQVYPGARHAGMPCAKVKAKHQRVIPTLADRVRALAASDEATTLLLPVNFGNTHWCGMIVDVTKKTIFYYDSLCASQYNAAVNDLAQIIVKDATPGSESDYEKARAFFVSLVPLEDGNSFIEYFTKNWHERREMWAMFERMDVAHLGNHTNNRIESSWSHIKPGLNPSKPIDEAVQELIDCQSDKENELDAKLQDIRRRIHYEYDDDMAQLLKMVSFFAADLVQPEYLAATRGLNEFKTEHMGSGLVAFRGRNSGSIRYTANVEEGVCTCPFYMTQLLPSAVT
ncbi:hypothetical protein P43SY_000949 [Pythium insidiosum]|uniref:Ubiquitin-like protease family profile domain-containing protein n=1 Tax=Pythium insidiosum TaxID=114742 RepID=A0AAD5Q5C0_PYTIN|nr:hypothetical protein P43SY_000949 [Pythium insidiosum]